MLRTTRVGICLLLLLSISASVARADEAIQARSYMDWLLKALNAIEEDWPRISEAAEVAAQPFIDGKAMGVRGGAGLSSELGGRAGGFMAYRGKAGEPGDIIVYALGVSTAENPDPAALLDVELKDAAALRDAGSVVIGIASFEQLRALRLLERARASTTALLDNHAPAADGLLTDKSGRAVVPTFTTANAAVAWVWTAELFAACTRQGKTPVMYKSYVVPGGRERGQKYEGQRFHEDIKVQPIPPGTLGKAYLKGLRGVLRDVASASWKPLAAAARRASDTLLEGGKVYIYAGGHYPPHHHGGQLAADPGRFTRLNHGRQRFLAEPGSEDFAIAIGYVQPPGAEWFGQPDLLRQAGRGVAWVITGYLTRKSDLHKGELLIDQQWAEGDALVKVPGYDVRICPSSGVVAEAIMWMLAAQVHATVERESR